MLLTASRTLSDSYSPKPYLLAVDDVTTYLVYKLYYGKTA